MTQTWRGGNLGSLFALDRHLIRRVQEVKSRVFCSISLPRPNPLVDILCSMKQSPSNRAAIHGHFSVAGDRITGAMRKGPSLPETKSLSSFARRTFSWPPSSGRFLLLVSVIGPPCWGHSIFHIIFKHVTSSCRKKSTAHTASNLLRGFCP